jgi:alcohol dehydrogenase class IV
MKYQKVIRGRDSLKKLPAMMEALGMKKPLIIGSGNLTGTLLRKVPALLTSPVYSGYHPNPDVQDALPAVESYRKFHCDGLISIGGGSAMDTAKTVKAVLLTGSAEKAMAGDFPEQTEGIPHVAIPGTAGTGAEATQNAVVYQGNIKKSISHAALRPEGVILDPELLSSLPLYHRKAAALDALCQGIESYWCKNATEDSRIHAFLAILGVLDNLKKYLKAIPMRKMK